MAKKEKIENIIKRKENCIFVLLFISSYFLTYWQGKMNHGIMDGLTKFVKPKPSYVVNANISVAKTPLRIYAKF